MVGVIDRDLSASGLRVVLVGDGQHRVEVPRIAPPYEDDRCRDSLIDEFPQLWPLLRLKERALPSALFGSSLPQLDFVKQAIQLEEIELSCHKGRE